MGLLDALFGKPNFHRHEDSYALDRASLNAAIKDAIEAQLSAQKLILVVAHFPATFESLQDAFAELEIEYEIVGTTIDSTWFEKFHDASQQVYLVLADQLENIVVDKGLQKSAPSLEVAMMICERHPIPETDKRLEAFARAIKCPTEIGYFLSLHDPIVYPIIGETTIKILRQMGMDDHELITSSMVSRRLNTRLRRDAKTNPSNKPAHSQQEWLEINRPAQG